MLGLNPQQNNLKDDSNLQALITGPGFGMGETKEQEENAKENATNEMYSSHVDESEAGVRLGRSEVVTIPTPCPSCGQTGKSLTALTDIPHFKEVIIMAFDCESCGYKNSEIRGGGAVPKKGSQITLKVTSTDDLKRLY